MLFCNSCSQRQRAPTSTQSGQAESNCEKMRKSAKNCGPQSPPPLPTPGVVKQDKSSGGSVDTTKTRSDPQRVRMSSGERPIGAAIGKQSDTEALCQPPKELWAMVREHKTRSANPPPPLLPTVGRWFSTNCHQRNGNRRGTVGKPDGPERQNPDAFKTARSPPPTPSPTPNRNSAPGTAHTCRVGDAGLLSRHTAQLRATRRCRRRFGSSPVHLTCSGEARQGLQRGQCPRHMPRPPSTHHTANSTHYSVA